MAYYLVTLIGQCSVLIDAKNKNEAADIGLKEFSNGKIKTDDFEVRKVITDEAEEADIKTLRNFDINVDLTK